MRAKLDDGKIKYIIREREKGTSSAAVAESMGVSARHVRRLWARYRSAGSLPTIGRGGRPATKTISDEEVRLVLAECRSGGLGVGRVVAVIKDGKTCKAYAFRPPTRMLRVSFHSFWPAPCASGGYNGIHADNRECRTGLPKRRLKEYRGAGRWHPDRHVKSFQLVHDRRHHAIGGRFAAAPAAVLDRYPGGRA